MAENENPTTSQDDDSRGKQRVSKALEIALAQTDTRCLIFFVVYVHFKRPFGIVAQYSVREMPSGFAWPCWYINNRVKKNKSI